MWLEQFYYLQRSASTVIHIWESVGFIDWEDHQKSSLGLTVPLKPSLLPTSGFKLSSLSKSLPASNLENIIITLSSKSSTLHVGIWGSLSMFSSYLISCPVCTMCCSIYPTPFPLPAGELNSHNNGIRGWGGLSFCSKCRSCTPWWLPVVFFWSAFLKLRFTEKQAGL